MLVIAIELTLAFGNWQEHKQVCDNNFAIWRLQPSSHRIPHRRGERGKSTPCGQSHWALKRSGGLARGVRMACATLSEALWWKPKKCPSDRSASRRDSALHHVPDNATSQVNAV